LGLRRAPKVGLDPEHLSALATWVLVAGFIGARVAHVTVYHWADYKDDLWSILRMWEGGMSSYGGFVGATLGGIAYVKRAKLDFYRYADLASYAFVPGWTIGRIGCFVIHDHPGAKSDFFLAAEMKTLPLNSMHYELAARHELGLYDGLLAGLIWLFFALAARKPRYSGFYLAWMCIIYSVPRFFLDSLRATDIVGADTRYLGLTPAQYGSIVLLAIGGWIAWSRRKNAPTPASA